MPEKSSGKKFLALSRMSKSERLAFLSFFGVILSAIIGGVFLLFSNAIPFIYSNSVSPNINSLKVANPGLEDWKSGALYALPKNINLSDFNKYSDDDYRFQFLNKNGYHVLYEYGDFSSISSQLPPNFDIPTSTIGSSSFPTIPFTMELWNLEKDSRIVIDEIRFDLKQYDPVSNDQQNLFILTGPGSGGYASDPEKRYSIAFSSNSKYVNTLVQNGERILVLEPKSFISVEISITFETSGRYLIVPTIKFHLPNGVKSSITLDEYYFSWLRTDYADGSSMGILR